jgi:hypothetical protein
MSFPGEVGPFRAGTGLKRSCHMSQINALWANGEHSHLTPKSLVELIGDSDMTPSVMARLVRQGSITIPTHDGEVVQVYYDGNEPQPQLPIVAPAAEYIAEVQLLLRLPAVIRCRAASADAAHALIEDVLITRTTPVPDGFSVTLQGDALERFGHRVSIAAGAGMTLKQPGLTTIASVVEINRLAPRGHDDWC